MTPYLNEAVVRDRIDRAMERAGHRRLARVARTGQMRRSGLQGLKDAVGLGLIAIGERLVEPPPKDTDDLRRAA
jgi:hypothetical protein